MNTLRPIYTEKRECQDCYKCVRRCPVKAIKVEKGCATVITELCVLCGRCVATCPSGAKRVRDDLPRVRELLAGGGRVVASLAPSWVAAFPGVQAGQLIAALRRLGFWGVSETALGAQEVSAHVAASLERGAGQVLLSSACPSAVALIGKYHPKAAHLITPLMSPLLAHCVLLRRQLGADVRVVFFGPCIAKKWEADTHPDLLDAALTFQDLDQWTRAAGIAFGGTPGDGDRFVPEAAQEGTLYPVDGGMIATVRERCTVEDPDCMALDGIEGIERGLEGVENLRPQRGLFVELLACEGGCVAGPKCGGAGGSVQRRRQVLEHARRAGRTAGRTPSADIDEPVKFLPVEQPDHLEHEIRDVLASIGKTSAEDELDCGGCGYETCRALARALLDGKAERAMCVANMRRLALKKANKLLRTIPSAVVIVDEKMHIIECNDAFAEMTRGRDAVASDLDGTPLQAAVPFANVFQGVLRSGEDLLDHELRLRGTILQGAIFSIEPNRVVGAVLQDVTKPAVQKEQIVRKAREVIQKQLSTVQQIAYLLGENAAESELILDSIIESYSPEAGREPGARRPDSSASKDDGSAELAKRHERDRDKNWKRPYRG